MRNSFERSSKTSSDSNVVNNTDVDMFTKLVFGVFGLAPSWMIVTSMMQQVPYFERTQPEGVCVTAFLTLGISCGVLWVVLNQAYMSLCNGGKPMEHIYSVPLTMSLSIFGLFFLAAFWHITVDNASIFLYISSWIGGGVGGLTQVLVMPFIALYKSDCLTAFRLGMDMGGIICALFAMLQRPGSPNPLFGPSLYFCVFGVFVCFGVGAYRYILITGIGLTEEEKRAGCRSEKQLEKSVDLTTMAASSLAGDLHADREEARGERGHDEKGPEKDSCEAPGRDESAGATSRARAKTTEVSIDGPDTHTIPIVNPIVERSQSSGLEEGLKGHAGHDDIPPTEAEVGELSKAGQNGCWHRILTCLRRTDEVLCSLETQIFDAIFAQICSWMPETMRDRAWFRITLPFMVTIFYMDANNFGLLPSLLPLALANATTSMERQMDLLQINFQVGAFMLVLADTLTFYIDVPLRYPLFAYMTLSLFIYCCSNAEALAGYDDHELGRIAILICCAYIFNYALSGYILIMAWRKASNEVPPQNRESSSRACGYADQISSFVGSVIALPIVLSSGSCM